MTSNSDLVRIAARAIGATTSNGPMLVIDVNAGDSIGMSATGISDRDWQSPVGFVADTNEVHYELVVVNLDGLDECTVTPAELCERTTQTTGRIAFVSAVEADVPVDLIERLTVALESLGWSRAFVETGVAPHMTHAVFEPCRLPTNKTSANYERMIFALQRELGFLQQKADGTTPATLEAVRQARHQSMIDRDRLISMLAQLEKLSWENQQVNQQMRTLKKRQSTQVRALEAKARKNRGLRPYLRALRHPIRTIKNRLVRG